MSLDSLKKLFVEEVRDIYNAEKQLLKALPRMAKAAESADLSQAFSKHLKETEGHVQRLERIFRELGQAVRGKQCKGMVGLLEEGKEKLEEEGEEAVLDAALIASAQAVEHYEITKYGSLIAWAKQLGREDCAAVLQQNLDEEGATDKKLTAMAEAKINARAA
jgi:ferritin-like metal-binding protein YciE